jgi:hypothetical protein
MYGTGQTNQFLGATEFSVASTYHFEPQDQVPTKEHPRCLPFLGCSRVKARCLQGLRYEFDSAIPQVDTLRALVPDGLAHISTHLPFQGRMPLTAPSTSKTSRALNLETSGIYAGQMVTQTRSKLRLGCSSQQSSTSSEIGMWLSNMHWLLYETIRQLVV